MRSPPVAAARSASASEALDCFVPVFGNSLAPAFLAGVLSEAGATLAATVTLTGTSSLDPSG